MLFPVFALGLLYADWLVSWLVLGHAPRPSIDDPKDIGCVNWMYPITAVGIFGLLPVMFGALTLNAYYVGSARLGWFRFAARIATVLAIFIGAVAWLRWDPGRVAHWWGD